MRNHGCEMKRSSKQLDRAEVVLFSLSTALKCCVVGDGLESRIVRLVVCKHSTQDERVEMYVYLKRETKFVSLPPRSLLSTIRIVSFSHHLLIFTGRNLYDCLLAKKGACLVQRSG